MLSSIHIENIALIKTLDLDFAKGFTAFTGETGAGKSIVVDAIGMVCGAKVSKDIIRSGEQFAKAEGLFCDLSPYSEAKCAELGIETDEDGCIFVSRTLSLDGKNTVTVNGRRIPLSLLKQAAAYIINIHGQHDNAELLNSEKHISILDSFASNQKCKAEYALKYEEYCSLKKKLSQTDLDEKEKQRRIDILKFQIDDIKNAKLKPGEEQRLTEQKKKLLYAEKINKSSSLCYSALYDSDSGYSAVENIGRAINALGSISGIIPEAQSLVERLETAKYELIDIAETANDFAESEFENSPLALDKIESRLDKISKLCSRYGADITDVLNFCQACVEELAQIELSEESKANIQKELQAVEKELLAKAQSLSSSRREAASKLASLIEAELQYLDMKSTKFKVQFTPLEEFCASGNDKIEFMIKINNGEGFNSLSKTASGGELSRIMLALKSVLSEKDGADTLIFDEIDTGISGSTSRKIGIKLKSLADKKQVLCVTHSAQVASLSDSHIKVSKNPLGDRTVTNVMLLSQEQKIKEIARIISGMDITDAAIESAKELINNIDE